MKQRSRRLVTSGKPAAASAATSDARGYSAVSATAEKLNAEIRMMAKTVKENTVEMGRLLLAMHESRLYGRLNPPFYSFGEYCKTACGFQDSTGYQYIRIYRAFGRGAPDLPTEKLALLASLPRSEVQKWVGRAKKISCADLKVQTAALRAVGREERNFGRPPAQDPRPYHVPAMLTAGERKVVDSALALAKELGGHAHMGPAMTDICQVFLDTFRERAEEGAA